MMRVVCHHQRAGVRSAAHIEFHTGYGFVAGGTGERCQRVLILTSGPTTMRDEVHATYHRRSRNCIVLRGPAAAQRCLTAYPCCLVLPSGGGGEHCSSGVAKTASGARRHCRADNDVVLGPLKRREVSLVEPQLHSDLICCHFSRSGTISLGRRMAMPGQMQSAINTRIIGTSMITVSFKA